MRLLGWNFDFTCRVLNGYRDFLRFKHAFGDCNAKKLSPSLPVDKMWHMHILDTRCYENDCKLLVGQVVHHDTDGDLNAEARKKRIDNTKRALKIQYPDGYFRNMVNQRKAKRASREPDSPINRVALITIRLRNPMGEETLLTIKQTTRVEKVGTWETPISLQLEDYDEMYVMPVLTGC